MSDWPLASPSPWPLRRLASLTTKIGSGATPRGGKEAYTPTGTAFIRSQNVLDHKMLIEGIARINDEAAYMLRGVEVRPGDVLLNITGDSIARCTVVDPTVLPARVSQHVAIIRPTDDLNPVFLQKYLTHPTFKKYMLSLSSGGTRAALTKGQIENFVVPCPPRWEQDAIAAVLGALDDKIAVNERIAATSLVLADAYFAEVSDGLSFGAETFGSVAQVYGGGTPRTSEPRFWDGEIAWTTPSDVTALKAPYLFDTSRKITDEGLRECASQLYPAGSIFMTSRATIGSFAIPQMPAAVNQGFIVVVPPSDEWRWWLFHEMRARVEEMISLANGSTFLELSRKNFKSMPVRLPPADRLARFSALVDPLHKRAAKTVEESHVLARLRDELLPGLMSGAIRVRDAEKIAEDVT